MFRNRITQPSLPPATLSRCVRGRAHITGTKLALQYISYDWRTVSIRPALYLLPLRSDDSLQFQMHALCIVHTERLAGFVFLTDSTESHRPDKLVVDLFTRSHKFSKTILAVKSILICSYHRKKQCVTFCNSHNFFKLLLKIALANFYFFLGTGALNPLQNFTCESNLHL